MGRKTYSFSAAAIAATATLSFTSADGVEAFAQDIAADAARQTETEQTAEELVEIVPEATVFTSEEVVQALPATEAAAGPSSATAASSLRELVNIVDTDAQLTEQMRCLASAVYFESRGEPLDGQLAVAQVVVNRAEDRRWPASYCGVVYQRSQFSFVRGGRMPSINTSSAAWERAKAVARIAHDDLWSSAAQDAVYFHASYVSPRWSRSKTRLTQIETHVFYR